MAPIHFLVRREHAYTVNAFLRSPLGRECARRLRPVAYEQLLRRMTRAYWWRLAKTCGWAVVADRRKGVSAVIRRAGETVGLLGRAVAGPTSLPHGVYVFADLERLSTDEARRAAVLWQTLSASGRPVRLLNHPTRSMRRYELLRNLREQGVNTFNVYRALEGRWPTRYPVFVREENDHAGPRTPLLNSRAELEDALAALDRDRLGRDGLLVEEFCDTVDALGIYRKYGAFVIGTRVFPKNVQFSKNWVLKSPDLTDADMLREERDHVERNPHEDQLRAIFRLARIEYGRIDYALLDGRIQVWEVNTNPTITSRTQGPRRAVYEQVERHMVQAFDEMARELEGGLAASPRRGRVEAG